MSVHINRYDGPGAADAEKLIKFVTECVESDEFDRAMIVPLRKKIDTIVQDCLDYIAYGTKDEMVDHIVGTAQRMAENFIDAIIAGNESAAKSAFNITGYVPADWAVKEWGFNQLRRALVEAHVGLLKTTYAADCEAEIAVLKKEILRLNGQVRELQDRL